MASALWEVSHVILCQRFPNGIISFNPYSNLMKYCSLSPQTKKRSEPLEDHTGDIQQSQALKILKSEALECQKKKSLDHGESNAPSKGSVDRNSSQSQSTLSVESPSSREHFRI